jgi:hypothetical protein
MVLQEFANSVDLIGSTDELGQVRRQRVCEQLTVDRHLAIFHPQGMQREDLTYPHEGSAVRDSDWRRIHLPWRSWTSAGPPDSNAGPQADSQAPLGHTTDAQWFRW